MLDLDEFGTERSLLMASILLGPKDGFAHLRGFLSRPPGRWRHFAAFQAVEFLHEARRGVLSREEVIAVTCLALRGEGGLGAVEALRRWKAWEAAPAVLALTRAADYDKKHRLRAEVICFCLECPWSPETATYLDREVTEDPLYVRRLKGSIPGLRRP
jgi:hypothetical protein